MKKFFRELQRRNVIKASISYMAISWVLPDIRYKNIRNSDSFEKLISTYTPVVDFVNID